MIMLMVVFSKYFKFLDKRRLNLHFKVKFFGVMLIDFSINSFWSPELAGSFQASILVRGFFFYI